MLVPLEVEKELVLDKDQRITKLDIDQKIAMLDIDQKTVTLDIDRNTTMLDKGQKRGRFDDDETLVSLYRKSKTKNSISTNLMYLFLHFVTNLF